jgi:hypothetical protein
MKAGIALTAEEVIDNAECSALLQVEQAEDCALVR